ncbi:MAG: sodium/glutamate symporter [Bryobacteraceae bacterium]
MPLTITLNSLHVLALAALGVALGEWLRARLGLLRRLSIPAPVAGGLVYALLTLGLRGRVNFEMDMSLRNLSMIAFFTTVGLGASWRVVRRGGPQLLLYLGVATLGAVLQNGLGIVLARAFGLDPLLGIVSGSVALAGGPATSLAFGPTFEKMGTQGAAVVGLASATFGITVAGLLSGYTGAWLIARRRLAGPGPGPAPTVAAAADSGPVLLPAVIAIAVCMGAGNLISAAIERTGAVLPAYIGAMIAAAILRNFDDRFGFARLESRGVAALGNIALYLFIVMALLTLRLWELAALALPLFVMLAAQVALALLLCVAISFPVMGRNYESAVMAAGYCGFMLGTTANAVAAMDELDRRFGPSPQAFLTVTLVGAFLIDFTNALIITGMANWVR